MTIEDFVRESNRIEGILREPTREEIFAHKQLICLDKLTVEDLVDFVKVVQSDARLRDNMSVPNVRVGYHVAPQSGPEIREQLAFILKQGADHWNKRMFSSMNVGPDNTIWRLHCDYETLHPFTDGNGRSGRAFWLWCMGGRAPLGFLHQFYYQTLSAYR